MQVSQIMTRAVISVGPAASISEVATVLFKNKIKGVPVVDTDNKVIGLITESDLVLQNAKFHMPTFIKFLDESIKMSDQQRNKVLAAMTDTAVREVMTEQVISVSPTTKVGDLANLMWEKKVNPVPVVEDGILAGIVSRADIIGFLAEK